LVLSVPSIIILLLNGQGYSLERLLKGSLPAVTQWLFQSILFAVSVVGLCLCWYLINLRQDAILYARAVNGLRRYFFKDYKSDIVREESIRVLPKNITQPRLLEWHLFFPVVLTFGVVDSLYAGLALVMVNGGEVTRWVPWGFAGSLVLHVAMYWYLAYHRDNYYLRSHKIGIDIDGVLNKQREQFAEVLLEKCGKKIYPEAITSIPVSNAGLGVTQEDEKSVFNEPKYWIEMPVRESASRAVQDISETFGYKVFIFTHRPWMPSKIHKISKKWLETNDIPYNRLILERGNVYASDTTYWFLRRGSLFRKPNSRTRSRFQYSRRKNFRYFVEDHPDNARKLADLCEYVFLIKHPYNESVNFPSNVIKVGGWEEILEQMKLLG
jgi:uncharacterized HAD superfamily protein